MFFCNFFKIIIISLFAIFPFSITLASDKINGDGLRFITAESDCGDDIEHVNSYNLAETKWLSMNKSSCLSKYECDVNAKSPEEISECRDYYRKIASGTGDQTASAYAKKYLSSFQVTPTSTEFTFVHCVGRHETDQNRLNLLRENGGTYVWCAK